MFVCGWQIGAERGGQTGARNFNRRGVGEIVGGCLAGRQSSRLESDNYFPNFPFLSQFDLPSASHPSSPCFFISLFLNNRPIFESSEMKI